MSEKAKGKQKQEGMASANWLALQKKEASIKMVSMRKKSKRVAVNQLSTPFKNGQSSRQTTDTIAETNFARGQGLPVVEEANDTSDAKAYLRKMIHGEANLSDEQKEPGKYLALDCEMVGVGHNGSESSLARVSLVNYNGAVTLDEFVRQRERVTDYRTFVSGVRPENLVNARPFAEVQKKVADLIDGRILVGHAVHNDLKALLLSQPRHSTCDTQICAGKARILKTKFPSLKKLVEHEIGVTIQRGEHSSVTDARATMALFRLHRKEWEKSLAHEKGRVQKRKRDTTDDSTQPELTQRKMKRKKDEDLPGGGRRGISSGLSTIVKHRLKHTNSNGAPETLNDRDGKGDWWSTLDSVRRL